MILINFAHPLTAAQCTGVEQCSGKPLGRLIEVKTQLNPEQPFAAQARQLVEAVGLCAEEWQTLPLVVNCARSQCRRQRHHNLSWQR